MTRVDERRPDTMKRRLVPVLGSSLLLWAVTANAAAIAPDDDPSLSVYLAPVRVVMPAQAERYSSWSFTCEFKGDNRQAEAVRFDVWDDSFRNQTVWNVPRQPPTWRIIATREELEGMNVRIRGKRGMWLGGPGSTCRVESIRTGEDLSIDEAWVVFGDILSQQETAAADREEARRSAIQERLGIAKESVDRLSQTR
jgi:hypothetical protein